MDDRALSWLEWEAAVRTELLRRAHLLRSAVERAHAGGVHPAGIVAAYSTLGDLYDAADAADIDQAVRLTKRIRERLAQELRWYRESVHAARAVIGEK